MWETQLRSLGQEDLLEKETASHSSVLAIYQLESNTKPALWDFPSGPLVNNPPCNAGNVGLIPSQGTKIPHAPTKESMP